MLEDISSEMIEFVCEMWREGSADVLLHIPTSFYGLRELFLAKKGIEILQQRHLPFPHF